MGILAPSPKFHSNGEAFTIHWQGKGRFAMPPPVFAAAPPLNFAQCLDVPSWSDILQQIDNTFVESASSCCVWDAENARIGLALRDSLNTQYNPRGVAFSIEHFWSPSSWKHESVILFRKIPPPTVLPVHPGFQVNSQHVPEAQLA